MDIIQFFEAQKATMSFGVIIIFVCCVLVIAASFIDMWTGIEAARANKEKISSRALRKTVSKIVDYLRVVMFALLIDILGLFFPWYNLPYCVILCTLGILLIEGFSVIENSKSIYHLYTTDEYPTVWGKDFQSESLFEFYFTQNEPAGGSGGEGAPMVYADMTLEWNNLVLTKDFLDLLNEDPDDVRHCITKMPVSIETDTLPKGSKGQPKYLGKYPGKTAGNPKDNNLCIVRLSEIRANPNKSVSDAEFTLERVLKERRKELVGEGLAVYDYTRNKLTIERVGGWHLINLTSANATSIPYNDPRHATPIPQGEQDANGNI